MCRISKNLCTLKRTKGDGRRRLERSNPATAPQIPLASQSRPGAEASSPGVISSGGFSILPVRHDSHSLNAWSGNAGSPASMKLGRRIPVDRTGQTSAFSKSGYGQKRPGALHPRHIRAQVFVPHGSRPTGIPSCSLIMPCAHLSSPAGGSHRMLSLW